MIVVFLVWQGPWGTRLFRERSPFAPPWGHGRPPVRVMDVRTQMPVCPRFWGPAQSFWPRTSARMTPGRLRISGPKTFTLGCFFVSPDSFNIHVVNWKVSMQCNHAVIQKSYQFNNNKHHRMLCLSLHILNSWRFFLRNSVMPLHAQILLKYLHVAMGASIFWTCYLISKELLGKW